MTFTKIAYIYGLLDEARPEEIRYVGKAVNPKQRLVLHLIPYALKKNTYKNNWAKSVLREGRRILMRILFIVPQDSWEKAERECIAFCSPIHRLTNGNEGGVGGGEPAPWVKEKMRVAGIARGAREKKLRAGWANRLWADPAYRQRMSDAHKGKKQSAEFIAKRIAASLRARKENRANRS